MAKEKVRVCVMCQEPNYRAKRSTCDESCERTRLFRSKIRAREINKGNPMVTAKTATMV